MFKGIIIIMAITAIFAPAFAACSDETNTVIVIGEDPFIRKSNGEPVGCKSPENEFTWVLSGFQKGSKGPFMPYMATCATKGHQVEIRSILLLIIDRGFKNLTSEQKELYEQHAHGAYFEEVEMMSSGGTY